MPVNCFIYSISCLEDYSVSKFLVLLQNTMKKDNKIHPGIIF